MSKLFVKLFKKKIACILRIYIKFERSAENSKK